MRVDFKNLLALFELDAQYQSIQLCSMCANERNYCASLEPEAVTRKLAHQQDHHEYKYNNISGWTQIEFDD